ncbi:hypothetical protein KSP40_PGU012973 [Platanthera guangdongensis]|uniref:RNase H type-1 domain-containing protein n=1 Tax=Platanthera guangdongensis TaxID=2320717 RepID=A0ABR2M612_9ASPA
MILHAWRVVNNLLPTNHWLFCHNLRINVDCPWGCGQEETVNHMLGDCNFWTSPPIGWLKINFDGSVWENFKAGLGCVVHTHLGEPLAARGVKSRSCSVDMTKFRSATEGLALAKIFFNKAAGIILEGDSSTACDMLQRILSGAFSGNAEAYFAKLLAEAPRVVISLIDRDANTVANSIAKLACDTYFEWERGMPQSHEFFHLVHHDIAL